MSIRTLLDSQGMSSRKITAIRVHAEKSYDVLELRKMITALCDEIVVLKRKKDPETGTILGWETVVGEDGNSYLQGKRVVTQK
jgi:hypothetical protein